MAKYSASARKKVGKALHEQKRGKLKSGAKSRTPVKSRKQAIAIGLSEARRSGARVPSRKSTSRKTASRSSTSRTRSSRSSTARRASPRKTASRKTSTRKTSSSRTRR